VLSRRNIRIAVLIAWAPVAAAVALATGSSTVFWVTLAAGFVISFLLNRVFLPDRETPG
jgi:hypothetical protein